MTLKYRLQVRSLVLQAVYLSTSIALRMMMGFHPRSTSRIILQVGPTARILVTRESLLLILRILHRLEKGLTESQAIFPSPRLPTKAQAMQQSIIIMPNKPSIQVTKGIPHTDQTHTSHLTRQA